MSITSDSTLTELAEDLVAEQASLESIVASLPDERWATWTPSPGWSVADQVGHLSYFDRAAANAVLDPDAFRASLPALAEAAATAGLDAFKLHDYRELAPAALLAAWRASRDELNAAAATLVDARRVPWYGPSMSARSFLSARLMETWAHGVDVADALGVTRLSTDRLGHVARLGFLTRGWSYAVRGETPPEGAVALVLDAPSGARWTWGEDAEDVVRGSAEEFCLVVTQRRRLADTSLETGELGRHWLTRAQAFAGAASNGPYEWRSP